MRISIASVVIAAGIVFSALPASSKTVRECDAEFEANKVAIVVNGTTKKKFVAQCRAGAEQVPGGAVAAPASQTPTQTAAPGASKTASECNADYAAQKADLRKQKIRKADFIKQCRTGVATAAPAPTAPPPSSPAPAPARYAPAPPATTAPTGANQFQTEGQAQSRCPGALVVWVNTKSRVYHFKGSRTYGNTKSGAYACEADATAGGSRAAKNEKHP